MYIVGSKGFDDEGLTYGINIEDKQLPDVFAIALRMRVVANGKATFIKFVSLQ